MLGVRWSRVRLSIAWPNVVARGGKSTRVNNRLTRLTTHPLSAMSSTPISDDHRRQRPARVEMPHARRNRQTVTMRQPIDEFSPRRLNRFPGVDARLQRRQRQIDLKQDARNIADLDDRTPKRVLHVLEAKRERSVERPHERRFDRIVVRPRSLRYAMTVTRPLVLSACLHLLSPDR